jgi:hypothetical protein
MLLYPHLKDEVNQMMQQLGEEPILDFRPAIELVGLQRVIDQVGLQRVINEVGPEKVLAVLGVEGILAHLTPEQLQELKRRLP